jgi:hypothetical protein
MLLPLPLPNRFQPISLIISGLKRFELLLDLIAFPTVGHPDSLADFCNLHKLDRPSSGANLFRIRGSLFVLISVLLLQLSRKTLVYAFPAHI